MELKDANDFRMAGHALLPFGEPIDLGTVKPLAKATEEAREPVDPGYDAPPPSDDDIPPGGGGGRDEDERPVIVISTDEHDVVGRAIDALASEPSLFQRAGSLVHVVRDLAPKANIARPPNAPRIVQMPAARIRELMAKCILWMKVDKRRKQSPLVAAHPPEWAVGQVAGRGEWVGIRPLDGVIESPTLRPDGTVLDRPGYDLETRLIYEPRTDIPPIPDRPTRADAAKACADLLSIVRDFPFASDEHRSAWLAGVLTPFARHAFEGPSPLFLVDANVPGAGKTMLANIAGIIATSRDLARMAYDQRDDEMRKRITATALAGDSLVLIDNVKGNFGCPSLDAALTSTRWSDRVLGKSENTPDLPLYCTWWTTGNNLQVPSDTARRTLHIRLNSPHERPEERQDFERRDLCAWVKSERPRFVAAALTVLRAYCAAGRPRQGMSEWGSFEEWSALVRGAIVWAGLTDPFVTRRALMEGSNRDSLMLGTLLGAWHRLYADDPSKATRPITISEMLRDFDSQRAKYPQHIADFDALRAAIDELCTGNQVTPRRVGKRLTEFRDRVCDGFVLKNGGADHNTLTWVVARA